MVAEAETVAPAAPKYFVDWWFVVPAIVGIVIALIRAGQFVAQMYSLKAVGHGLGFVVNTTFGLPFSGGYLVVHHGQIEGDPGDDDEILMKLGGPGVLLIKENTAVLTERGRALFTRARPGRAHAEALRAHSHDLRSAHPDHDGQRSRRHQRRHSGARACHYLVSLHVADAE